MPERRLAPYCAMAASILQHVSLPAQIRDLCTLLLPIVFAPITTLVTASWCHNPCGNSHPLSVSLSASVLLLLYTAAKKQG